MEESRDVYKKETLSQTGVEDQPLFKSSPSGSKYNQTLSSGFNFKANGFIVDDVQTFAITNPVEQVFKFKVAYKKVPIVIGLARFPQGDTIYRIDTSGAGSQLVISMSDITFIRWPLAARVTIMIYKVDGLF